MYRVFPKRFFHNVKNSKYQYFDKFKKKDNLVILSLNGPDKMNVLNKQLFEEADDILNRFVLNDDKVKGVIFISSKKDNFIAGADIKMLQNIKSRDEVLEITKGGNNFFQNLKKKDIHLISAINGNCMGGGLEWAMYCDYRIASDNPKTIFSLPEVKLGLMPGMGGTYNLPKLVGFTKSLDIMLTGKNIKVNKAKDFGLIDEIVPEEFLEEEAIKKTKLLIENSLAKKNKPFSWLDYISNFSIFRQYILKEAEKKVKKVTKGKMPAPIKIIDSLKNSHKMTLDSYLNLESNNFADLIETKESKALIGLFRGSSEIKNHNFGESKDIKNILVMGAGLMGSGIADVSSKKFEVAVNDNNQKNIEIASNKLKNKNISFINQDINTNSDMIIEAVYEDLDVKKNILANLEKNTNLRKDFIFASNTSAIPISKIAENSKKPENVIGMHYFSPVQKMPLIEIIPHSGTSNQTIATAYDVASKQGKIPILVKDVPGFFVNRCLAPLLVEIPKLLEEGVKFDKIEKAMLNFGMPVGPLTLSDEVGLDISKHVSDLMSKSDLGIRMEGDTSLIQEMIDNKWLGKKSGQGFYNYSNKKEINNNLIKLLEKRNIEYGKSNLTEEEIKLRLIGKFINEVIYSYQNEIIKTPLEGDLGSVLGIGFPPHYGGPFRMLDQLGINDYYFKMSNISDKFGKQYEPPPILKDYIRHNNRFYLN